MEENRSCYISIEGKRSFDGSLSDYKKGCAVLAISTAATIVPIIFHGAREVLPHGEWRVRPGKIQMILCEKISTVGLNYEDRNSLTSKLRTIAELELSQSKKEQQSILAQ